MKMIAFQILDTITRVDERFCKHISHLTSRVATAVIMDQILPKEVLKVCQIFGFLPVKYKFDLSKGIEFSMKAFLWGLTLVIFHSTGSFIALCIDYIGKQRKHPIRMVSNTSMIAVLFDVVTLVSLGIVFFCSATKNCQNLEEVYRNMLRFDYALQHKFKVINLKPKICLIYTLMTVFICFTIYFYYVQYNNFLIYVPFYTVFYLQAAQFIHFTFTCHILKERFLVINDKIKQAVIRQSFGQLLKDLEHHWPPEDRTSTDTESVAKLCSLTDLYWILCDAAHQAESFYCSQLFFVVASAFVHITMTLYYFFIQMWPSVQDKEIPHLIMRMLWVIAHSSHLVLILRASTSVTKAAGGAAPMVCKLINRRLDFELRKHLEVFLTQLSHHNVRFSAMGFFNVHSHILTSLAGSVTTYLVILIQFQTQTQINLPPPTVCPVCNCSSDRYQTLSP